MAAAPLPPTLWWVARRSMRVLATLALAAIVLSSGAAAERADDRPVPRTPAVSTEARPPLGPVEAQPDLAAEHAEHADRADTGATGVDLTGPVVRSGAPAGELGAVPWAAPARPSGNLSGPALGQRAPPRG